MLMRMLTFTVRREYWNCYTSSARKRTVAAATFRHEIQCAVLHQGIPGLPQTRLNLRIAPVDLNTEYPSTVMLIPEPVPVI